MDEDICNTIKAQVENCQYYQKKEVKLVNLSKDIWGFEVKEANLVVESERAPSSHNQNRLGCLLPCKRSTNDIFRLAPNIT